MGRITSIRVLVELVEQPGFPYMLLSPTGKAKQPEDSVRCPGDAWGCSGREQILGYPRLVAQLVQVAVVEGHGSNSSPSTPDFRPNNSPSATWSSFQSCDYLL